MELSLKGFFHDFHGSKLIVYLSLLIFTLLLALKEDNAIQAPYWAVFLPLLMWKLIAILGAIVGCVVHCRNPPPVTDVYSRMEFRSMILSFIQHLLLLAFEVLTVYKLETKDNRLMWIYVFVPLFLQSFMAAFVCIWSFELFFSVNILQFVFLALKLDGVVPWEYVVILIPLWILICLSVIAVLYAIVLAVLLLRSIELLPEHRRQHVYTAIAYTFLVVPILIFLVLLTSKLDQNSESLRWFMVCTPLYVSLICLLLMACGTRGGNHWWFGLRRDFCTFLLDSCPCLQEYGNVSIKIGRDSSHRRSTADTAVNASTGEGTAGGVRRTRSNRTQQQQGDDVTDASIQLTPQIGLIPKDLKPVIPVVSIELPD